MEGQSNPQKKKRKKEKGKENTFRTNLLMLHVKARERQKLTLDYFQQAARRERPSCLATRSGWGQTNAR